jgi:hypothetical protein
LNQIAGTLADGVLVMDPSDRAAVGAIIEKIYRPDAPDMTPIRQAWRSRRRARSGRKRTSPSGASRVCPHANVAGVQA